MGINAASRTLLEAMSGLDIVIQSGGNYIDNSLSLSAKIMPRLLDAILINTLGVEKRSFFSRSVIMSIIDLCIYQGAKIRMFFDLQTKFKDFLLLSLKIFIICRKEIIIQGF